MNPDSITRALDAADDLQHLLRMAHSAVRRLEMETCGGVFEHADSVSQDIHRARQRAERLRLELERSVSQPRSHERSQAARGPAAPQRSSSFLGRKTI